MAIQMYEQAMRKEARRLIAEHGELVEVRCVSGPPDYRIELVFADGHEEVITEHSGRIDITMMKFGYLGTGTRCFHAFLDEAGFKGVSLEQLAEMEGPKVLHREAPPEEMRQAPEPVRPSKVGEGLPLWADVSRDPSLMDPLILEKLQKSMCFMVRDETGPVAALILRASPDEFREPLTAETPMSPYVYRYRAQVCDVYGVYPIVWDDPDQPQFKETWVVGARRFAGPPDPLVEGGLSKLEALLSQEYTYFLVVDRSNRVVAARRVNYSPKTQQYFLNLLPKVRVAKNVTVSDAEFVSAVKEYLDRVSLEQVTAAARRLHVAEELGRKPEELVEKAEEPAAPSEAVQKPIPPAEVMKEPAWPAEAAKAKSGLRRVCTWVISFLAGACLLIFLGIAWGVGWDHSRGLPTYVLEEEMGVAMKFLFGALAMALVSVLLCKRKRRAAAIWGAAVAASLIAGAVMAMPLLKEELLGPMAVAPPRETPVPTFTAFPATLTPTPYPTPTPTMALPTTTPSPDAVVKADVLNLRAGPGTDYDVVGQVRDGDTLVITGRTSAGDWLEVITPNGSEGWVAASFVQINVDLEEAPVAQAPSTPTPAPQPPTPTAETRGLDWAEFCQPSPEDEEEQVANLAIGRTVELEGYLYVKYMSTIKDNKMVFTFRPIPYDVHRSEEWHNACEMHVWIPIGEGPNHVCELPRTFKFSEVVIWDKDGREIACWQGGLDSCHVYVKGKVVETYGAETGLGGSNTISLIEIELQ